MVACLATALAIAGLASCSVVGAGNNTSYVDANGDPIAPANVSVTGVSCTQVKVTWSAVPKATNYTVYYTDDGTTPTEDNNTDYFDFITGTTNTFIPDSYSENPSGVYPIQVVVSASNDNGEGNASMIASGSGLTPTNVTAAANTGSNRATYPTKITWSAVTGASTYIVYRSQSTQPSTLIAPTYSATNPFTTANLSCTWSGTSTNYFEFAVAGVDASGNVGPLSPVSNYFQPSTGASGPGVAAAAIAPLPGKTHVVKHKAKR
jgi:hypothetical protein